MRSKLFLLGAPLVCVSVLASAEPIDRVAASAVGAPLIMIENPTLGGRPLLANTAVENARQNLEGPRSRRARRICRLLGYRDAILPEVVWYRQLRWHESDPDPTAIEIDAHGAPVAAQAQVFLLDGESAAYQAAKQWCDWADSARDFRDCLGTAPSLASSVHWASFSSLGCQTPLHAPRPAAGAVNEGHEDRRVVSADANLEARPALGAGAVVPVR